MNKRPSYGGLQIDRNEQQPGRVCEALDPEVMRATVGDDPEIIRELVREFVPAAWSDIAEINAAVTNAEAERVRLTSHKLKGSSGLVGARELVELCRKLEAAGNIADWPAIGTLAAGLDRLMRDIEVAARPYLENTTGS
jgi:HPt (histidine-containing phosphotransfer) domain-containing protein